MQQLLHQIQKISIHKKAVRCHPIHTHTHQRRGKVLAGVSMSDNVGNFPSQQRHKEMQMFLALLYLFRPLFNDLFLFLALPSVYLFPFATFLCLFHSSSSFSCPSPFYYLFLFLLQYQLCSSFHLIPFLLLPVFLICFPCSFFFYLLFLLYFPLFLLLSLFFFFSSHSFAFFSVSLCHFSMFLLLIILLPSSFFSSSQPFALSSFPMPPTPPGSCYIVYRYRQVVSDYTAIHKQRIIR